MLTDDVSSKNREISDEMMSGSSGQDEVAKGRKLSLSRLEKRFEAQAKLLYDSIKRSRQYGKWRERLEALQTTYRAICEAASPDYVEEPEVPEG
jgi:hypothetical protein